MAATKFIRVSCQLPAGVTLGSAMKRSIGGSRFMDSFLPEGFGGLLREHAHVQSTEPVLLTLECPEGLAPELAKALRALAKELTGE